MNAKHFFTVAFLFTCATAQLKAQDNGMHPQPSERGPRNQHQMNIVKLNLTAIAVKTYAFQYERIITRRFSLGLSYRVMPTGKLPFSHSIAKAVADDDADTQATIENMRIGNHAFTPEARLYLGKGYGQGFYITAFYQHSNYTLDHLPVNYDDSHSLDLTGKLSANTGGIMLGAQWALGRYLSLDWWIVGPHYGSGKGDFVGIANQPLNPIQQQVLRDNLEDIDIPLTHKTVAVNATGATMNLDGPWGGLRSGILLGVKF